MTRSEYAEVARLVAAVTGRLGGAGRLSPDSAEGAAVFLARLRYEGGTVIRCAACGQLLGVTNGVLTPSDHHTATCGRCGPCEVVAEHEETER